MRVWIASLVFYFFVFSLCELLRFISFHAFSRLKRKQSSGKLIHIEQLANEFIGTVQICAPMFDVNFVLDNYGLQGVLIEIALIEFVNAFLLRDAHADPCPLLISYLRGRNTIRRAGSLLAVEFVAGYCSYLLARAFWKMGAHRSHLEILHRDCSSDLTTTIMFGSMVEAVGLLANKAASLMYEKHLLTKSNYLTAASALTSGLITVIGIHLTGMYANPIVAWACTFNCGEVSHLAHFLVYWVAPFSAWLLAEKLMGDDDEREITKGE